MSSLATLARGGYVRQRKIERQRTRAALQEAEERLRTAFEDAPVGMAVAGLEGELLEVNRALCEMTGYSDEQLLSGTLRSLLHPDDALADERALGRLLSGEASQYRAERRYVRAAGSTVPVDLSVAVIRDAEGSPRHVLLQAHDITERKQFEDRLQYLADHDALTGMFNRRRFEQELGRELARAARFETHGALLAIDLDHFRYVNDTLGHAVGDELIVQVGDIFRRRLRETDTIARLGGDEFSVILPGADAEEAVLVATGLLAGLREQGRTVSDTGHPRRVTASVGVAPFGGRRMTGEELAVEADIAMYDAKEAGRDRVRLYDATGERRQRMHSRLTWADRIRDALEEDRFVLHAQPILALGEDLLPRHELLIRMRGKAGDLIPPGIFLYIGERFDLIQMIDHWVLEQAIGILAEAKRAGRQIHIEVNLSAKSVTDPELPDYLADTLRGAGTDGAGLCVEVTETAAIVNVDRAKRFAQRLGELGCEFALDDFGAGFASFYYLKHLAFDYVKIDGEFIHNLPDSHVNQLVVKSVVDIAAGLGKRTVAEFVGDERTLGLLRKFGVDYAQGFYVARPKPLEAMDLTRRPSVPTG